MSHVFFCDRNLGRHFPQILRADGFDVVRHDDLFDQSTEDTDWIESVARRGWVALSHDSQIRYKQNERDAVIEHGLRLFIVHGKVPHAELAHNVVRTRKKIGHFLSIEPGPWIAKVHRPSPAELRQHALAPGGVERWFPPR